MSAQPYKGIRSSAGLSYLYITKYLYGPIRLFSIAKVKANQSEVEVGAGKDNDKDKSKAIAICVAAS